MINFKIGNVIFTTTDIIFLSGIIILLVLSFIWNFKLLKKIKTFPLKFIFIVELIIRFICIYYIFYFFIFILSTEPFSIKIVFFGLLLALSLFVPALAEIMFVVLSMMF